MYRDRLLTFRTSPWPQIITRLCDTREGGTRRMLAPDRETAPTFRACAPQASLRDACAASACTSSRTGSVHGDGVNALTERFGRADRKGQRAPGARSAGGVVDADDRQGGAVRRNSDRGSGPRPGYSDAIQARRSAASCRAGLDGDPSRAEAAICDPGAALEGVPTGECQGLWLLALLRALPWP
jgi:hypothetical protein